MIWITFLRGINVGGNNLLPMKELSALLTKTGCRDVTTYIQSGNIVFKNAESNADKLSRRLEKAILDQRGFQPRVFLISQKELEKAAKSNPFKKAESDPSTLHLNFLSKPPKASALESLKKIQAPSEEIALRGLVLYLHAPDGIGRSKLAAGLERALQVEATGRNWRTVTKVLELVRKTENPT